MPEKIVIVIFRQISISFCILYGNVLLPLQMQTQMQAHPVVADEISLWHAIRYPVVFVLY